MANGPFAGGGAQVTEDILFFFDREPQALSLFELLCEQAMARWPSSTLRVQKTQITFSDPRGYLFASRPRRRGGGLMVSFGLSAPLQSPRLFAVANPAPGRYTHHVQVRDFSELDSFVVYICMEGKASIRDNKGNEIYIHQGQTVLIPADTDVVTISPVPGAKFMETYIG